MTVEKTPFKDLLIIKSAVYGDKRGYFTENYNLRDWTLAGISTNFIQDNLSLSKKDILRGLHFQLPPYAQAKVVRAIKGSVLDVVVDIRRRSETYGKHFSIVLSDENYLQLYIPEGFAHGFVTLEDNTIFSYKCSNYYHHEVERGLAWNDIDLNINWGILDPVLSDKDKQYEAFSQFVSPF
ncbi:MAG: dTDP-4-dehydrorhamnose 3,5-epimerase [Sphingobacteriales bacterium]|nr:MAG: dTDP-4-dehydrorhamnose 3,5-epimerase [Sphingobacteriales bacterium]